MERHLATHDMPRYNEVKGIAHPPLLECVHAILHLVRFRKTHWGTKASALALWLNNRTSTPNSRRHCPHMNTIARSSTSQDCSSGASFPHQMQRRWLCRQTQGQSCHKGRHASPRGQLYQHFPTRGKLSACYDWEVEEFTNSEIRQ